MKRALQGLLLIVLLLVPAGGAYAETVASLPAPTGYVNDFASVLSPATKQNLEDLCTQVDRQAHAQIAVVTIKTLENDQPVDDFANRLEEKWKVGAKGTDRGILMLIVLNPRRRWIEVGYGLEGILNDAKVGDIGRSMVPYLSAGDYDQGITTGVRQIAQVIAADAGVTITGVPPPTHYYHRQTQTVSLSPLQVIVVGGVILVVVILLASTGNLGLLFFLLGNLMGGGGGGYRRRDGGGGGGFGGFGGGGSGGGGAGGDY
jgi:uncharacterized protein